MNGCSTRKELSALYNVSLQKFDDMVEPLRPLFKQTGNRKVIYFPFEIQIISERYGTPKNDTVMK